MRQHLGYDEKSDWKAPGLNPEDRADRFAHDMRDRRNIGQHLSWSELQAWVVKLIYAVTASDLSKITEDHEESVCVMCGASVYCCYPVELQKHLDGLKLQLAQEKVRNHELTEKVRDLESHTGRKP